MVGDKFTILLCVIALIGCGCSVPVLRQDLPVSSNPLGATIYADGEVVGQTPATVSLARNRDHLLTLVKEDYRQVDVAVTRQYQSDRVLMRAVQMGMNSGHFFHDTRMGLNRGFNAVSEQEASGEAYILVPSVVQVELTPLAGLPSAVIEPSTDSSQADGTSVQPDGTMVTEHSRTTVGVRGNAEALPAILDALFR